MMVKCRKKRPAPVAAEQERKSPHRPTPEEAQRELRRKLENSEKIPFTVGDRYSLLDLIYHQKRS